MTTKPNIVIMMFFGIRLIAHEDLIKHHAS